MQKREKFKNLEKRVCIPLKEEDKIRLEIAADFNRLKPAPFARQCILLTLDEFGKAMEINKAGERKVDVS